MKIRTGSSGKWTATSFWATSEDLSYVTPIPGAVYYTNGQDTPGDGFGGVWVGLPVAAPGTYVHDGFTTLVPPTGDGSRAIGRVSGAFLVGPLANGDAPASWRSPQRCGVLIVAADTVFGLPPEVSDYGVKIMAIYTNEAGSESSFNLRSWNGGDAFHVHATTENPTATSGSANVANLFLAFESMRFYLNNRQADIGQRYYRVNLFL